MTVMFFAFTFFPFVLSDDVNVPSAKLATTVRDAEMKLIELF